MYLLTWPADEMIVAVTRFDGPDGERLTFDHYREGQAEDLFDVALYGTGPDDPDYQKCLGALQDCVEAMNIVDGYDVTSSASRQHYIDTGHYLKRGEADNV